MIIIDNAEFFGVQLFVVDGGVVVVVVDDVVWVCFNDVVCVDVIFDLHKSFIAFHHSYASSLFH